MRTDYFRHLKGAVTFVTSTQNSNVTNRQEEKPNENNALAGLSRLSRLSREKTSGSANCHVSRLHSSGVELPKNNHTICNDNSDTQSSKLARRYFATLPKNSRDKRDTRDKEKNARDNNGLMPRVSVTLPENSHVTDVTNVVGSDETEGAPSLAVTAALPSLSPDEQEAYEERSAIMEFDGNLPRQEAERLAAANRQDMPKVAAAPAPVSSNLAVVAPLSNRTEPPEPEPKERLCYQCAHFDRSPYGFPLGLCQQHGNRLQHSTSQPVRFGYCHFVIRQPDDDSKTCLA